MRHLVIGAHATREDIEPVAVALEAPPLFFSACNVAGDQPLGDRELLLRVARMRGALLDRATFVAIRYGFAVHSAAEAASKCAPHLRRWRDLLERHRDRVEMTLKVAAAASRPRPVRGDYATGSDYLKALHAAANAADIDPEFRIAADRTLGAPAVEARWLHRDNTALELVVLVRREAVDSVMRAGESLKRDFPRVPFLLSGPWPLEAFADADHE